jgi:hypothetical protein
VGINPENSLLKKAVAMGFFEDDQSVRISSQDEKSKLLLDDSRVESESGKQGGL